MPVAAVLVVLMAGVASAADYYVDATNGLDANPGTSPAAAWKSLSKVTSFAYAPGDKVFFKRGETWRGLWRITRSGNAAAPITFGAYGTGDKPTINGSAVVTTWTSAGANLWTTSIGSRVEQTFFNGIRGNQRGSAAAVTGASDWFWGSGTLTIFHVGTPANVEASSDLAPVLINSASFVSLQDIRVIRGVFPVWMLNANSIDLNGITVQDGAGYGGIFLVAISSGRGRNNTVRNCHVTGMLGTVSARNDDNNGSGICIDGGGHAGANTILDNTLHDNGHEGIQIGESDSNLIKGNTVYNHRQAGIRLGLPKCHSNIIEHNLVYDNAQGTDDRYGIDLINVGNDNIVRYNITHGQNVVAGGPYQSGGIRFDGNNGIGTVLTESTGNIAYYNLIYDEYTGINVFSHSNVTVMHNTIVDTKTHGIAANAPDGILPSNNIIGNNIIAPASGSAIAHVNLLNTVINHNCYVLNSGSYFVWGTLFIPWNTYRTLSGQDADSLTTNPLFVDLAARDYRLQEGSPLRDIAFPMSFPHDILGTPVPYGDGPDIGAYEYTDAPPPDGEGDGIADGEGDGTADGEGDGTPDGEGANDGAPDGEGVSDGATEGTADGEGDGDSDGEGDGISDGEGTADGEGAAEGFLDGEGSAEGVGEGTTDGEGDPDVPTYGYTFEASTTQGQAPLSVSFTGVEYLQEKHHPAYWEWDFGDGTEAVGQLQQHKYHTPGTYTVTLKITTETDQTLIQRPQYISVSQPLPAPRYWLAIAALLLAALLALRRATPGSRDS